jgi:hypothetical protein
MADGIASIALPNADAVAATAFSPAAITGAVSHPARHVMDTVAVMMMW